MFGIIANDDQVEDDEATEVIGKSANFIGFRAKLAKEAFQEVGGVKSQALLPPTIIKLAG
jgi:hypothetical protein